MAGVTTWMQRVGTFSRLVFVFVLLECVSLSLYLSLSVKTWMQLVGSFPRLATCSGLHIRPTASARKRLRLFCDWQEQ